MAEHGDHPSLASYKQEVACSSHAPPMAPDRRRLSVPQGASRRPIGLKDLVRDAAETAPR